MSQDTAIRPFALHIKSSVQRIGSAIVIVGLLALGYYGSHAFAPTQTLEERVEDAEAPDAEVGTLVTLPAAKLESAGIRTSQVAWRDMQVTETVPGTISYDDAHHVEVRAPVPSVVEDVLVRPGQTVHKADILAVLSSAEVGLARNELKRYESEAELARLNHEWKKQTYDNLCDLLASLSEQPSFAQLEAKFDEKLLGEYRDRLLTAYSESVLATSAVDRSSALGDQGVISARDLEERISAREIAAAHFRAACERSRNEGKQELARAAAELDVAERQIDVSQERLRLLLGPFGEETAMPTAGQFEVRSPLGGRIEELGAVAGNRVTENEQLFVIADTKKLWLSAQIHQRDWSALAAAEHQTLRFTVPALPEETFEARVIFIGAAVSPTTGAIPLVAAVDNTEGRFRPGMFAWASVPIAAKQRTLAVPTAAIQRHEGHAFVFVEEEPGRYRRSDVEIATETPDWCAIANGVREGDQVVDHGAFFLKSELLLEQEEE